MNKDRIIDYFIRENISMVPLRDKTPKKKKAKPGEKPFTQMRNKDWVEYLNLDTVQDYGKYLKKLTSRQGFGFGVVPFDDFIVVDFDPGHSDGKPGFLTGEKQRKKLIKLLGGSYARTLYATKPNSKNLHLFYKDDAGISINKINALKKCGIDCDLFSIKHQTRIYPDYSFANLDISKGFIEQMASTPEIITQIATEEDRRMIEASKRLKNHDYKSSNGEDWLTRTINRWTYQGRFIEGSQNNNLFKFALYAMKNGYGESEVQDFLEGFTASVIPQMTEVVPSCVKSASHYVK